MNNTCKRRMAALSLFLCFLFTAVAPAAQAADAPAITATSAILLDPSNNMVLYEKAADEKRFPASTTKIMTALIVLNTVTNLDESVTVTEEDFIDVDADSSKAGFKVGEQISVIDLLYGLLLPSGNEAANTLARHVGGTVEDFVQMMNAEAKALGCTGTHFVNPSGLHDDDHYTTARDLSKIAIKAMQNETFADIASTAQKTLGETNMTAGRGGKPLKIFTSNRLIFSRNDPLYYSFAKGIKTGHTSQAGYCLVSTATKRKSTLISVLLHSDRPKGAAQPLTFAETKQLFEWGFSNFTSKTLVKDGETVEEIPIRLSTDCDHIALQTQTKLDAIVPIDIDMEKVVRTSVLPDDLTAPIKAGDVIGTLEVSYNGVTYGSVNLVSMRDVSLSKVLYYADKLENFFKSALFKFIILALVVLLIVYIIYFVSVGRDRRRRKQRVQHSRSRYRRYK